MVQQVGIIGLGLIGSSIGLALRRSQRPPRIVGYDLAPDATRAALKLHAVDRAAAGLMEVLRGTDLLVLATPVRAIISTLETIGPYVPAGCVVTDTGSTKLAIVEAATRLLPAGASFVGGHPMTGRLTAGSDGPSATLFQDTTYCLTPTAAAGAEEVQRVVRFVESLGAVPYFLDAAEHDGLMAGVSHLPYLLSAALMSTLAADSGWRELATLAAGGFTTVTRLVEGDPRMFTDVCLTNREAIARRLDDLIRQLTSLRELIAAGDEALEARLARAREARAAWEQVRIGGAEPPLPTPSPLPGMGSLLGGALRGRLPDGRR